MTRSQLLVFAQLLYETDANRSKPIWQDLGETTQSVWIDKVKASQTIHPATSDLRLRELWRAAGGSFHGLNVTGTMPEKNLLPFLRVFLYKG